MSLSPLDRLLIQRTQETMDRFSKTDFVETRNLGAARPATGMCPAPGCTTPTRGGPCKKHWRMRHGGGASGMSEGGGKTRR